MKKSNKKSYNILFNLIVGGAFAAFTMSTTFDISQAANTSNTYEQMQETISQKEETRNIEKQEMSLLEEKFSQMKEINEDYLAWISIENTNINYPIVQGNDNDFYLKHDFSKKKSGSGAIFLDYTNKSLNDPYSILYGHNMAIYNTMFNDLNKFKNQEFFNQNNQIKITTEKSEDVYEIISVSVLHESYPYLKTQLKTEELKGFMQNIEKEALFRSDVEIDNATQILTLSTCSYEFTGARTVVHAKKVTNN